MPEGLASLLVLALQTLGLAALALSQASHWQRLTQRPLPGTRGLRLGALLISGMAWGLSLASLGLGMGTLFWVISWLPCGLAVSVSLYRRAAWLRVLARGWCR